MPATLVQARMHGVRKAQTKVEVRQIPDCHNPCHRLHFQWMHGAKKAATKVEVKGLLMGSAPARR